MNDIILYYANGKYKLTIKENDRRAYIHRLSDSGYWNLDDIYNFINNKIDCNRPYYKDNVDDYDVLNYFNKMLKLKIFL